MYLWEAMKLLIMPPAIQLRNRTIDHRAIIAKVLKCRPEIKAKRREIVKTPSIIRAEFTREREQLDEFRLKLKSNIQDENVKQRQRIKQLKTKYDREGVEVIEDVSQIGKGTDPEAQRRKAE